MSNKYDNPDEIQKRLDVLAEYILVTLSQIMKERQYLADNLKEGYINMAKSRYVMRGQNISMLQINTSNLKPTLKTSSSLSVLEGVEFTSFSPVELKSSIDKNTENFTEISDELCERIENVVDKTHNCDESKELGLNVEKDTNIFPGDPLKWFGVLVPDVLKKSQVRFKQATITALQIASLQNQLKSFSTEYKTLRLIKKSMY